MIVTIKITLFFILCQFCVCFDGWHCLNHDLHCLYGLPHKFVSALTNKHLVFLGDSLTRYQYIDLVYMLRHKNVLRPEMTPNLVLERQWASWNEFYKTISTMFAPYEVCDCFRNGDDFHDIFENRFYHDPTLNMSVTYLSYLGTPTSLFQGHLFPADLAAPNLYQQYPKPFAQYAKWQYFDLPSVVAEIVNNLVPKADFVVLNYGKWQLSITDDDRTKMLALLKEKETMLIWKTTTWGKNDRKESAYGVETEKYRAANQVIMDTNWTLEVNSTYYWDVNHFDEPLYSILNSQLYEMIHGDEKNERLNLLSEK